MSEYSISKIYSSDRHSMQQVEELLNAEGIRKDANLDYTCGIFDDDMNVIATGSCFGNTLRCMAVSSEHQGEGLMNTIVSHLTSVQFERGNYHIFLYTKCSSSKFFKDLGFNEIARIEDQVVFMENKKTGFSDYLKHLAKTKTDGAKIAALVMNANPFTLGHQYLVEKAAAENDVVHLFMVSEDASLVPYAVRKNLIMEGVAHLDNVICHDSGPYIISNATFPSYFQKDSNAVIESHANLDISVFCRIADSLGINRRYVGEEPNSVVTGLYNEIMQRELPKHAIECIVVPRKSAANGEVISASTVRKAIHDGTLDTIKNLVPETTYRYFASEEAAPVIKKIQASNDIIHY